jgi:preprotein translocase subunit SecG
VRVVGWLGTAFFTVALLVCLGAYGNVYRVSNAPLPETYRTLFFGFLLFPVGLVLSLVLVRANQSKGVGQKRP